MSNWEKTMKEWDDSVPDGIKYLSAEKQVLMRRVRELESENARLKDAQRWRVVANGELPKIRIPVLFLADWGSIYEGCTYDGKNIALYDLEDYEDSDITHWMPLPVLPEVQE